MTGLVTKITSALLLFAGHRRDASPLSASISPYITYEDGSIGR